MKGSLLLAYIMSLKAFLSALGDEINDVEEETFLLFSQSIPSQSLGFVDSKTMSLDLTIQGRDLTIIQSPGLLSSKRREGTTGAVVWKITPAFADWIASEGNILFNSGPLHSHAVILELGCGVSGILASLLAPKIGRYIATDQGYVFKLLRENLLANAPQPKIRGKSGGKRAEVKGATVDADTNIDILALDWETDSASSLSSYLPPELGIDLVIACDCIYNEALIEPFVNTCADICRLRQNPEFSGKHAVCVIAQQLRSDVVFEAWLSSFHRLFHVWRMPDAVLNQNLQSGRGFVVHAGILRVKRDAKG